MYFALALLAVLVSATLPAHRLPIRMPASVERFLTHVAVVPVAVVVLVLAEHAFLQLLLDATYHQHPMRPFMAQMPVRFIGALGPATISEHYRTLFALLVLVETGALLALYYGLARTTRTKLAFVAFGTLIACADAALSRAATSADMYAYVGFTLLGAHAYTPQAASFAGNYSLINVWWHTPLVSAPYGPMWLVIADGAAAFGHTLFEKIVLLRLLGAFALLATAGTLSKLGVPLRVVALVALNPALIFIFIANVHNDLFAVTLLLVARFATTRGAIRAGIALAVAASLVKLPFLLFGALPFVAIPRRRDRIRAYGVMLALGVSASWIFGGSAYLAALHRAADEGTAGHAISAFIGGAALMKVVALAAVAAALLSGIFLEGCAWTLPALGALLHPWYLCWTLPYAVAMEDALRNVAIALPVVMLFTDTALGNGVLIGAIAALAYVWLVLCLARNFAPRFALRKSRT